MSEGTVQVQEVKAFLSSKTIKGLLLTGVTALAQVVLGVTLDADAAQEATTALINVLCTLVELGGIGWAAYGRAVAAGPLVATTKKADTANQAISKTVGALVAALLLPALFSGPAWAGDAAYLEAATTTWLVAAFYLVTGIVAGLVAFFLFDKISLRGFDTASELARGNWAVGMAVLGLFIMVGLIVSKGMG